MPRMPHTSSCSNYTWGTLSNNNCGRPSRQFPFRQCCNFLPPWSAWPAFPLVHCHNGSIWISQTLLFQSFVKLQFGTVCCFRMSFSSCQSLPHPFWGGIYWARSRPLFSWIWNPLFLTEQNVNSGVWVVEKLWVYHKMLFLPLSHSKTLTHFHIKSSVH